MRTIGLLLLSASALALPACGGNDGNGSSNGVTEKQWAAKVNSYCRQNSARSQQIALDVQRNLAPGSDPRAEVIKRSLPYERQLLEKIGAVKAPSDVQGDFDDFVDELRRSLPLLEQIPAVTSGSKDDQQLKAKLQSVAAKTRPFAKKHRLTDC